MTSRTLLCSFALTLIAPFATVAQDHDHDSPSGTEGEVFEYNVGEVNYFTGEGVNPGGFLFPNLFIVGTGGVFEPGGSAEDFATSEHDPQNDVGFQGIELHLGINVNDIVTGAVRGFGHQGAEDEWEAELEEAFLHYHLTENFAIGGGQFLNVFGFQADKHLHAWEFVNQNLINSRMLNEGELITQGGEALVSFPRINGLLSIGAGGVRTHAHAHDEEEGEHEHEDEEEEDHDHDEEEEEHHHLEADGANFASWVLTTDFKFRLPSDESSTVSTSFAAGENGFGGNTYAYGVGFEKIWGAHDHGHGPEFCTGAVMFRTEFIGRSINGHDEDGEALDFDDEGVSTALFYGLSDRSTISLRHDWVSGLEDLELDERHRISPAFTTYLGKNQRLRARVQYDYTDSDAIETEHAAWLQFQWQWGGEPGGRHQHNH